MQRNNISTSGNIININNVENPEVLERARQFSEIEKEMLATYKKKNNDYGDAFTESMKEFGLTCSAIRLGDKYRRLKSLLNKRQCVEDESIEDTLLDMANYAIMTVMYIRQNKSN